MRSRQFDLMHLDVERFAKSGASLDGSWSLAVLARLVASMHAEAPPPETVVAGWRIRGESREAPGATAQTWLHLSAQTQVVLECQRCLAPVEVPLSIERSFLFVHGEQTAEQLDSESEDDVLAMTHALNVRDLVEDELLLALPLVPRHETCALSLLTHLQPLPSEEPDHPFAALAVLKRE